MTRWKIFVYDLYDNTVTLLVFPLVISAYIALLAFMFSDPISALKIGCTNYACMWAIIIWAEWGIAGTEARNERDKAMKALARLGEDDD